MTSRIMYQIGLSSDQGRPPEPTPEEHDLAEITAAAANIAAALDHLGATEIYKALEVFYPQLDKIEGELHNMIHGIRSRQRDTALPAARTRRDPLGLFRT